MDTVLFKRLLHEEESVLLDFKREQYRFSKATDEEKSELLKDILGFANAWRRADSYILIGVEDVRGGQGNVVGISEQLHDHALQQFVNNKTNRPIQFHYEAFNYQGIEVGIVRIDLVQGRPVYLKEDYGRLRARDVYIRRGSSTDPKRPATPDEIADMGRSLPTAADPPDLRVEFAEVERDAAIGTTISWEASALTFPERLDIPDHTGHRRFSDFAIEYDNNKNFYREFATYAAFYALYRQVRLVVVNSGATLASDVRIELDIVSAAGLSVKNYGPSKPRRRHELLPLSNPDIYQDIRSIQRAPGDVDVVESKDGSRLEVECHNMQPGRKVWSDKFYIAVRTDGRAVMPGRIFAATLPPPTEFSLAIDASIEEESISVEQLRQMAKEVGA